MNQNHSRGCEMPPRGEESQGPGRWESRSLAAA